MGACLLACCMLAYCLSCPVLSCPVLHSVLPTVYLSLTRHTVWALCQCVYAKCSVEASQTFSSAISRWSKLKIYFHHKSHTTVASCTVNSNEHTLTCVSHKYLSG